MDWKVNKPDKMPIDYSISRHLLFSAFWIACEKLLSWRYLWCIIHCNHYNIETNTNSDNFTIKRGKPMETSFLEVQEALKSSNIQLTHQRLSVLEYLKRNRNHPTVDSIYKDLHGEIPTLSKTTVYNTLRILEEAGLVRVLTIEDNETRYDIQADDHGHFKCESCGMIYNFKVDFDKLISDDLNQFKVNDKNIYFKGICPKCLLEEMNK